MRSLLTSRKADIDGSFLFVTVVVLLSATSSLTPWWGIPVVAALLRLLLEAPVRWLTMLSFVTTSAVCALRDFQNDFGPSRVFSKLFSLESLGFALDTELTRVATYAVIGLVSAWLAFTASVTVQLLQSLRSLSERGSN